MTFILNLYGCGVPRNRLKQQNGCFDSSWDIRKVLAPCSPLTGPKLFFQQKQNIFGQDVKDPACGANIKLGLKSANIKAFHVFVLNFYFAQLLQIFI